MKNQTGMFLIGLLAGVVLSSLLLFWAMPRFMFTVSESKYSFEQTTEVLAAAVQENQWGLQHKYDLQHTLAQKGITVNPAHVYSICKPDLASRILSADADRHVAAMMPCRVAVYEKDNGKTYIARMNAGLFAFFLSKNAKSVMKDAAGGSEKIFESVIKQ